jgi:hypothetical protein
MWRVEIAHDTLTVTRPDGARETADLGAVTRVLVVTNDSGPAGLDVWFVIVSGDPEVECGFPLGATGYSQVLERLKTLPGFQLRGMNSTKNMNFECWPDPSTEPVPL